MNVKERKYGRFHVFLAQRLNRIKEELDGTQDEDILAACEHIAGAVLKANPSNGFALALIKQIKSIREAKALEEENRRQQEEQERKRQEEEARRRQEEETQRRRAEERRKQEEAERRREERTRQQEQQRIRDIENGKMAFYVISLICLIVAEIVFFANLVGHGVEVSASGVLCLTACIFFAVACAAFLIPVIISLVRVKQGQVNKIRFGTTFTIMAAILAIASGIIYGPMEVGFNPAKSLIIRVNSKSQISSTTSSATSRVHFTVANKCRYAMIKAIGTMTFVTPYGTSVWDVSFNNIKANSTSEHYINFIENRDRTPLYSTSYSDLTVKLEFKTFAFEGGLSSFSFTNGVVTLQKE